MLMKLFVGLIIQEKTTFPIYLRLHSTPQKKKLKKRFGMPNFFSWRVLLDDERNFVLL